MEDIAPSNRLYENLSSLRRMPNLETKHQIETDDHTFNKSSELVEVDEMLSICAEYEQNNSESCMKSLSSIHMTQNRIKTNGSLPREKSFSLKSNQRSPDVPGLSGLNNNLGHSNESITNQKKIESSQHHTIIQESENTLKHVPQSPRTKIRTCVNPNKTYELNEYDSLVYDFEKKIKEEIKTRMNIEDSTESNITNGNLKDNNSILNNINVRRNRTLEDIRVLKRKIAELQCEEDEIFRDLDLEEALLTAELTTENIAIKRLEQDLTKVQNQIHRLEAQRNASRVMQETQQAKLKQTISFKQNQAESFQRMLIEDESIQNELDRVSESLENDKKLFEDLEFQYLEEESEWISKKEELLMRLKFIKRRIFRMKSHTSGLEQQTYYFQQMICDDTKDLEHDLLVMIQELEKKREFLRELERQIMCLHNSGREVEKATDTNSIKHSLLSQSLPAWDSSFSKYTSDNDRMCESFNENTLSCKFENLNSKNNRANIDVSNAQEFSAGDSTNDNIRSNDYWDVNLGSNSVREVDFGTFNGSSQRGKRWSSPDILNGEGNIVEKISNSRIRQSRIPTYKSSNDVSKSKRAQISENLSDHRKSSSSDLDSLKQKSNGERRNPKHQRPLTRYLPTTSFNFDLRYHIESAGHQISLCRFVVIDENSCKGYLHKLGATFKGWSKRWFVLDRVQQAFVYYTDKNEKRARGGAYFSAIEEVYLDHLNTSKSDRPDCTFVVKTKKRIYHLQAASSAATRIWIDVIMTGAFGNEDFAPIV